MTYSNIYPLINNFFFGYEMPDLMTSCISDILTCIVLFLIYILPLVFLYFSFKFILRCFLWDL